MVASGPSSNYDEADFNHGLLGALDSPETKFLIEADSAAEFHPSGYLLFVRQGALLAQRFDVGAGELIGDPIAVADGVILDQDGKAGVSVSASGLVAYRRGGSDLNLQLAWFDRAGQEVGLLGGGRSNLGQVLISPDGRRVATTADGDIWMMDIDSPAFRQFTFNPETETWPAWSPDSEQIAFSFPGEIRQKQSSGAGGEELLLQEAGSLPSDWSPDGRSLLYVLFDSPNIDLRTLPIEGDDRESRPYLTDPGYVETRGQFSPNGRWIAYDSNELGEFEIYVRPFPASEGGQWRVSTDGGKFARWDETGQELYYLTSEGMLMAVAVETTGETFQHGSATALFQTRITAADLANVSTPYDVSSDGQFLMVVSGEEVEASPITLIQNWNPEGNQ